MNNIFNIIFTSFNLGYLNIKERYIRSYIGPFWISISLFIQIIILGIVFGFLFKQNLNEFLPHLSIGLMMWMFFQSILSESCNLSLESSHLLLNSKVNFRVLILQMISRNILIMFHHLIIIILILFYFKISINLSYPFLIFSILILGFFSYSISMIIAILSTRFNDIQQIVLSTMSMIFYLTPIIWKIEFLGERASILNYNIFYHMIEIFRAILLYDLEKIIFHFSICVVVTFILAIFSEIIYKKFKNKIVYYL